MSWFSLLKQEIRALFTNQAAVFTVFGGVIIYSLLYPVPYSQQTPRELSVAIVDQDGSQTSRMFTRMMDATPEITVTRELPTVDSAAELIATGVIDGVVSIPEHFYRDLLMGKSPVVSVAGDASFFLVYGTVVTGVVNAGKDLGAKVKVAKSVLRNTPLALASKQYTPFDLNLTPVYNPTMGYGNYAIPGVFMLILQQTLMLASALIGCQQMVSKGQSSAYWNTSNPLLVVLTRSLVIVAIYAIMAMYYLGACLEANGINRLSHPIELASVVLPFLFASSGLGILLGYLFKRAESLSLAILVSSMPMLFVSGFIWPTAALPVWLQGLAQIIPSTAVIPAVLQLNQMGATPADEIHYVVQLLLQAISYLSLAALLLFGAQRMFRNEHKHITTSQ
ncbi:ABC transporter permease [Veronia pacifica]|uniref:ABC transporter n=1 Tax=Veronia pacifica TaxID=1080227 RepID=A0A1C3EQX7_9GAMM|nr:ABC transporter permease [Veronia pacifica]ODA35643.1 ABC transporter [Veronia pacifica]